MMMMHLMHSSYLIRSTKQMNSVTVKVIAEMEIHRKGSLGQDK